MLLYDASPPSLCLQNYQLTRICFQLRVIIYSASCHSLSRTSWLFYLRVLECLWTLSRRWILALSLRISVSSSISLLSTCWHMRAKTATISLQCREEYPSQIIQTNISNVCLHAGLWRAPLSFFWAVFSLEMKYSLKVTVMIKSWKRQVMSHLPFT